MKLALDHHYAPVIAERLRNLGHDVIAAREVGWEAEDDEALLVLCTSERRALLTYNVADFELIARRWQMEGRSHGGLIYTSDASMPRTKEMVGVFVDALRALMVANPSEGDRDDRVQWLSRPARA